MLVIDGHNLIPKIPGWSLGAVDDEEQLIQVLQRFSRVKRKAVQVFFDGAPVGQAGTRAYGMVTAHFVQAGKTADEAIHQYLVRLKKGAKNVTVVTSDRMVQVNARALGAGVLPSEDFARQLIDLGAELDFQAAKARSRPRKGPETSQPAAGSNLDHWYDLFHIDPTQAEKPIEMKPTPAKSVPKKPKTSRKHHGFDKKGKE